jgi:hypothetical protein
VFECFFLFIQQLPVILHAAVYGIEHVAQQKIVFGLVFA